MKDKKTLQKETLQSIVELKGKCQARYCQNCPISNDETGMWCYQFILNQASAHEKNTLTLFSQLLLPYAEKRLMEMALEEFLGFDGETSE